MNPIHILIFVQSDYAITLTLLPQGFSGIITLERVRIKTFIRECTLLTLPILVDAKPTSLVILAGELLRI
jgi:hypothetical protein